MLTAMFPASATATRTDPAARLLGERAAGTQPSAYTTAISPNG